MTDPPDRSELDTNLTDHLTAIAKSALGAVPVAGSLLAEIAGSVIPKQRIDRLVEFSSFLSAKIDEVDEEFLKSQVTNENFTDLTEEAMRQAASSVSEDRRKQIAHLVAEGLKNEDVEYSESRHLLRILGELNDVEIILLRFYLIPTMGGDDEFRGKHSAVLEPLVATMGSSRTELDKVALRESYERHLTRLGLIKPVFRVDSATKEPLFDKTSGAQEVLRQQITPLGRLLLRHIDLTADGEESRFYPMG